MVSDPILHICTCVTIDAMLNFDGEVDVEAKADVKCEQSITVEITNVTHVESTQGSYANLAKY